MPRSSSLNFQTKILAQPKISKSSCLNSISAIESDLSINLNDLTKILEEPEYAIWTKIYGPDITKTLFKHILNY